MSTYFLGHDKVQTIVLLKATCIIFFLFLLVLYLFSFVYKHVKFSWMNKQLRYVYRKRSTRASYLGPDITKS